LSYIWLILEFEVVVLKMFYNLTVYKILPKISTNEGIVAITMFISLHSEA